MTIGVVILTMGTRPHELSRAIDSVLAQRDVDLDVVVVGNGWQPEGVPTPSPDWASSKTAGSSDRETHAWSIIGLERAAGD